ncbi:putative F-box/kelch-repeat protein At1g12870 [Neltuma alba]|uniref:putative F-box/kelch-repeat protein At1g12870 n=1 Tax=Neltuma alba TaxID=207710 RepID=UPI0010A4675C|nr:putative F-box/kelch-repeat protein At1g12870 [Prosopis alba]
MILVRLPVKSLIRFQCVSKEWKNLFKTPSFIAEHLQHSTHQNPLLIFEDFDFYDRFRLRLLNREMRVRDVQTHPRINSRHSFVWAVNSCNGLICIVGLLHRTQSLSIFLWNPATRKLREVPAGDYDLWVIVSLYVGFGFSPTLNDYKIVKIRMNNLWVINEVEVYSLNKRRWKEVELGSLDGVAVTSHGFTFNGAIFWIGSNLGGSILVSFDIATEVFTLIPMPPIRLWGTRTYSHKLTVYDNKLAMLFPEGDSVHLWVMEEEKYEWKKLSLIVY